MLGRVEALAGKTFRAATPEDARAYVRAMARRQIGGRLECAVLERMWNHGSSGRAIGFYDGAGVTRAVCNRGCRHYQRRLCTGGYRARWSCCRARDEARLISLLPPVHMAIVPEERVLTGLDDLLSILPEPAEQYELHGPDHWAQPYRGYRADPGARRARAGRNTRDSGRVVMKACVVFLLVCVCALAQTHHHAPEAQPAVDLAKVPKPVAIDGIGHSHIAITTKSPEVQRWFDQGLALLHCFWDYEALRAFAEALRLDPDCAMCHWGAARALTARGGNEDLAKAELKKAKELSEKASDREQRYIRADVASQEKEGDEATSAFGKEMEALVARYPEDVEARLLYALELNHGYDEKGDPRLGTVYGQASLRDLLREHPDNAAANHYWIHAVEGSAHPEWAVESAEKLGRLAPSSGHMVHMPGHIFYRIGDYERARQIFLDAMRVDRDYMAAQHVSVRDDWNYAHNLSYLIADCSEEGRYSEALEHGRTLAGLANDPDSTESPAFYVLQIGSTEERLAIRYGRWEDAIGHPMNFGVADDKLNVWARGYRDGLVMYARGMQAAETEHLAEAEAQANALDALLWRLSQEDLEDKKKGPRDRVLKLLGTAALELRGDIAGHRGDFATARTLLERADEAGSKLGYSEPPQYSRPPLEVLGAVCTRAGKFDDARVAFHKVLVAHPKSGFALYGIAVAWEKEGKRNEAAKAYREFLDAWSHADRDLPQIRAAQTFLAADSGRSPSSGQ